MSAGRWSFFIEKGAVFDKTITWETGSPLAPVDITGYHAKLQVRRAPGDPTILLELTDAGSDGLIEIGDAAGTFRLLIDATTTDTLVWSGRAYYDMLILPPGGAWGVDDIRFVEGRVTLSPPVTIP